MDQLKQLVEDIENAVRRNSNLTNVSTGNDFRCGTILSIVDASSDSPSPTSSSQTLEVAQGVTAPVAAAVPPPSPVARATVRDINSGHQNTDNSSHKDRSDREHGQNYDGDDDNDATVTPQSTPHDFPLSPPRKTTELIPDNAMSDLYESSPEPELPDIAELIGRTRPNSQRPTPKPRSKASIMPSPSKASTAGSPSMTPPASGTPLEPKGRLGDMGLSIPRPPGISFESPSSSRKRTIDITFPSSSEPPAKRPKRMSKAAMKHEKWWLLDGNVVLQVEHTQFKLHRSFLARHSPFFAKLFQGQYVGPLAYTENGEFDGGTLFYISDTCVGDFEHLLEVLDNALVYRQSPPTFPIIASILRASTVLDFPVPRDFAVQLLQDMWSDDLRNVTTDHIHNATETVVLGRAYDVPSVLKRALYELVRMPGLGERRLDSEEDAEVLEAENRLALLDRADLRRLVHAREQLSSQWLAADRSGPTAFNCPQLSNENAPTNSTSPSDGRATSTSSHGQVESSKTTASKCTSGNAAIWYEMVHGSGIFEEYLNDPICGLVELGDLDWDFEGYCKGCIKVRKNAWAKQREKIWKNLDWWLEL